MLCCVEKFIILKVDNSSFHKCFKLFVNLMEPEFTKGGFSPITCLSFILSLSVYPTVATTFFKRDVFVSTETQKWCIPSDNTKLYVGKFDKPEQ